MDAKDTKTAASGGGPAYRLIRLGLMLMSLVPRTWMARLAALAGGIWYAVDRRHRKIALDNLAAAFPERSGAWVRRTARATFVHLAVVALELPSLLRMRQDNLADYVRFSGMENIRAAREKDTGMLLLTAHFGNWELLAVAMSLAFDFTIHVVARALDFAPLDRAVAEMRGRTGNVIIDKENSAQTLAALLREKKVIGILLDQNAAPYEGVYVPFFGRTACTNKGLALLALRHRALVVPCFATREPDGRYHVEAGPPISLERTGNIRHDVETNTALFNRVMEEYIRRAPWQWLWVHRRWRMIGRE